MSFRYTAYAIKKMASFICQSDILYRYAIIIAAKIEMCLRFKDDRDCDRDCDNREF